MICATDESYENAMTTTAPLHYESSLSRRRTARTRVAHKRADDNGHADVLIDGFPPAVGYSVESLRT